MAFPNPIIRLSEPKPFIAGKVPFDLSFLPPDMNIDAVYAVVAGALNVPAAGVTALQLQRLLDNTEQERRIKASGLGLQVLDHQHAGRRAFAPAAIVGPNAAAAVELAWPLAFADTRGVDVGDHPPSTSHYANKTWDLYFKDPASLVAALAVNAGAQVYLEFHLSPLSVGKVSTSTVIGAIPVVGKQTKLPGGLRYLDVVLVKDDGAALTDAELGNMRLTIDGGQDIITRTRIGSLVRDFNRNVAADAGGAIDPASIAFGPLVHPRKQYKGTKLPVVAEVLDFTYDGTLAANVATLYYRAIEERSEAKVVQAGQKLWGKRLGAIKAAAPKTASKNGYDAGKRGFLSCFAARVFGG